MDLSVIIRDVRSFAGRHVVPVRPLTILLGENSTGKSTFLATMAALLDETFPLRLDVNRPPYDLGSHDNIVNAQRRKTGKTTDFSVGFTVDDTTNRRRTEVVATYVGHRGQIELSSFLLKGGAGELSLSIEAEIMTGRLAFTEDSETFEFNFHTPGRPMPSDLYSLVMMSVLRGASADTSKRENLKHFESIQRRVFELINAVNSKGQRPYSVAPIRMKPKRTYDQVSENFSPEGDHIPILLSRIYGDDAASKSRSTLVEALRRFGSDSGLFKDLRVRRLGSRPTDPFQIQIATGGYMANLADVGYGVSQALPVVVQSVISSRAGVLLLQQPEVHLHPRAQAALGTFFSELVGVQGKQFIIETHSDYLVDRIRQEIAARRLEASSVAILFFDRSEHGTRVTRLEVDSIGNFVSTPRRYREFFLKEQAQLLKRG